FAGACCVLVLAPTSSFVPIKDLAFEHRCYLPLAGVLLLAVVGAWRFVCRCAPRMQPLLPGFSAASALALAVLTVRRNEDYRSALRLMERTVECAPKNARAYLNLGAALLEAGRTEEAIRELTTGMGLDPLDGLIQQNLGAAYWQLGKSERAIYYIERGVRLKETPLGLGSLGHALFETGDFLGSAYYFQKAFELSPDDPAAHYQLANALEKLRRSDE